MNDFHYIYIYNLIGGRGVQQGPRPRSKFLQGTGSRVPEAGVRGAGYREQGCTALKKVPSPGRWVGRGSALEEKKNGGYSISWKFQNPDFREIMQKSAISLKFPKNQSKRFIYFNVTNFRGHKPS